MNITKRDARIMRRTVRKNFKRWSEKLISGRHKEIAELYSRSATFFPTFSGEYLKGRKEIERYFRYFMEKNPAIRIKRGVVQLFGSDSYLYSGIYVIDHVYHVGKRKIEEARFSIFWERINGVWQISHHHSSLNPDRT